MAEDDPRHGKVKGFNAGCRKDCCRLANNRYAAMRRQRTTIYGTTGLLLPAIGTHRRLEGLMALGWTCEEISHAAGFENQTPRARGRILRIRDAAQVRPETAEAIAKAAKVLARTKQPPRPLRARQRNYAARQGWVPLHAWDDIDDSEEKPKGVARCAELDCVWAVVNRGRCDRHYRQWLKAQKDQVAA